MGLLSLGSTEIKKISLGSVDIKKISLGTLEVWSAITLTALGMDKSGTQALNQNSTYLQITGWAPQAGTAAGDIVSNALIVNGPGKVFVTAKATGNSGYQPTITLQLRRNGTTAATSPGGTTTASLFHVLTAAKDDALTLWGNAGSVASSYPWTVAAGNANTFLQYAPVIVDTAKVGTQVTTTAWAKVTGWDNVNASNELVVTAAKSGASISAAMPFTASASSSTVTLRIKVNGTVVATGTGVAGSSGTPTVTATGLTLAVDDKVTLEVMTSSTFGNPTLQAGGILVVT